MSKSIIVIPVAGCGLRLGLGIPKCMARVRGNTLVGHLLRDVKDDDDIRFVVGYRSDLVVNEVGVHRPGTRIIHNERWGETNTAHSVALGVADVDGMSDVIVIDGDLLLRPGTIDAFRGNGGPLVGVKPIESQDPMLAKVVGGNVVSFSKEDGNYEWAGICRVQVSSFARPSRYVCDCIPLPAQPVTVSTWEIDTPLDLERAQQWTM